MEEWKDIPGWEGVYQISNFGHIKSFKRFKEGKILSNNNKNGSYLSVVISAKNKESYSTRMHRLVAEAFIPNMENKKEINHMDGNKQNNHFANLEWVTPSENIQHAMKRKPQMIAGMNHYNQYIRPKTILQISIGGNILGIFPNAQEAGRKTGVCGRNILQVANKTEYKPGQIRSQAGGFRWKFKEENNDTINKNFNISQW